MSGRATTTGTRPLRPRTVWSPGVSAIVTDDQGRVLMQRRSDSGNWALPGGTMDIGETLQQCPVREVKEETGPDIAITGLLGIYTDPPHEIADAEVRQECNVTYLGRIVGATIAVTDESTDVRFIDQDELNEVPDAGERAAAAAPFRVGARPALPGLEDMSVFAIV